MRLARSASLGRAAIIMILILGRPGYFTMPIDASSWGPTRLNFIMIQFSLTCAGHKRQALLAGTRELLLCNRLGRTKIQACSNSKGIEIRSHPI